MSLRPGQTRHVRLHLDPERLAYWNVAADGWAVAAGQYKVFIGASSRDLRLQTTVRIVERH